MYDSQKWYPIDDHVYTGHVQDAIDAGISLNFTLHLAPVSGPVIGKMAINLLKIHNKIDSNTQQSGCIMLIHLPTLMQRETSIT